MASRKRSQSRAQWKDRFKSLSALEKKREKDRAVADVMDNSNDQNDPDTQTARNLLDQKMVKMYQTFMVFIYGMICILSIFALSFYLFDQLAYVFDGSFDAYLDYVLLGVVILTILGSIFGCFLAYKFGSIGTNIAHFAKRTSELKKKVESFTQVQEMLQDQVQNLESTLNGIGSQKDSMLNTAAQFAQLSETVYDGNSDTQFGGMVDEMYESIWEQLENIKIEAEKAEILKHFYDKQDLDDDEPGLNRKEFEYVLLELDEEFQERFPRFEDLDLDHDGNIDIFEFEKWLNTVYQEILKERKAKANRKMSNHSKNKKERKQYVKQRNEKIQKEKHKGLMRRFSRLMK